MLKSGIWVKHIKCRDDCHTTQTLDRKGDDVDVKREESAKFKLIQPTRLRNKTENEVAHVHDSIEGSGSITCYN